jgi:diaminohydroxyphosphoribosylaminopyrimidine deaminase / 5-amino-6-(5-phosphoribosylamino)uracil reductase
MLAAPHHNYMQRCLQLARLGAGAVAPNPMVGAVLVHEERIIGEGYHRQYGGPHAEVDCIASVKAEDRPLIPHATLYVSLEPCAHFGKTPPCADLILAHSIRKVVVGCRDPFAAVNGKGIEKLQAAGVAVTVGILEEECRWLNQRFFCFHQQHRPYVVLKWAQTADGKIAAVGKDRLLISNEQTNRLVHRWRSEEMAILVGRNTAMLDDPSLTTRLWPGRQPLRLVVDAQLRLSQHLHLFDGSVPTLVFNLHQHTMSDEWKEAKGRKGVGYYQISEDSLLVHQILQALYMLNIQSVLVEGGARLLQSFIDDGSWDEARIITNTRLSIGEGLPAPQLNASCLQQQFALDNDAISFYTPITRS